MDSFVVEEEDLIMIFTHGREKPKT